MRKMGRHRWHIVIAATLAIALGPFLANASEIKQLQLKSGPTGTRAEFQLDASTHYRLIPLSNPARLVVDFPEGRLARGLSLPTGQGVVTGIRTGHPEPGVLRVVFDLANPVAALPVTLRPNGSGATLVLEWPGDGVAPAPAVPAAAAPQPGAGASDATATAARTATAADQPQPAAVAASPAGAPRPTAAATPAAEPDRALPLAPPSLATLRAGMRPLVVAIDAGHGGQDPGAHGLNGTREKDVTLAIARELARQVNATPGLRAYLTRDSDVFIPLGRRARLASAHHADIFVSIHADAAVNRSAQGASVYILSTRGASSQRARWLADKENAADIIGGERVRSAGDTLTAVLLDLTQSGNMKASEDAADHVLDGLKQIGNIHKSEIERANFAVLRTSDKMPAMLVETAFISNPDEEKRLKDPAFQQTLARAILAGIDAYFTRQPPPGTLYAARAQAAYPESAGGSR